MKDRTSNGMRLLKRSLAGLAAIAALLAGGAATVTASAADTGGDDVSLPNYYMDGMVFQRGKPFVVKGTATPGSSLTVSIGSQSATATAGADGSFCAEVPASPASFDPYELTVSSGGKVVKDIKHVYSGDVFIAAGQSNMEASYDLYYRDNKDAMMNLRNVITRADLPVPTADANIRYIKTDQKSSDTPTTDLPLRYSQDSWLDASTSTDKISYTAYYTAAAMRKKNPGVPVGVIDVAWGGTNIATQLNTIWNNHMNPLSGFNVGGVVWYQGESDTTYNVPAWMHEQFYLNNNGKDLPGLIDKFRTLADDTKLPFVVVQLTRSNLANFFYSPIRDAQSKAVEAKENAALVVGIDTDKGTSELIHPLGKDIIGARAGTALLSLLSGGKPVQGPTPLNATADGNTVTVTFKGDTGKGLKAMSPIYDRTATADRYATDDASDDIDEVDVAGSDGVFWPAKATVSGDKLVVTAQGIQGTPTQVRYAWDNQPAHPNLYNGANLPAGTFVVDVDGATVNPKPRSVLFNDYGGGDTITPISGNAGARAQIPLKTPTRAKYTFKEWNTKPNGTGTAYHPGQVFSIPDVNLTALYAIWTADTAPVASHTVTFDANGGSATAKQTVKNGDKATKPADPTRNGFTFAGWTLNGQTYDFTKPVTTDITLVAQWKANTTTATTHTVTFDANGGSATAKQTVKNGDKATKPADPTRNGFTFAGWTLNGQTYDFAKPVTTDITLVAQWKANAATGGDTKPTQSGAGVTVEPTGRTNEYRVSMSVKGSASSENSRTPTDYIVFVDESGSMNNTDSTGSKRSEYVRQSLTRLASSVLTARNSARPAAQRDRIAVIRSNQDSRKFKTGVDWRDNADEVKALTVTEVGNTPWASWLAAMHNQAKTARAGARKVGIFITDGSPDSAYYDWRSWEDPDGQYNADPRLKASDSRGREYARALIQTKDLAADGWTSFYNIGIDIASQQCDGNVASGNTDDVMIACLTPKGVDIPDSTFDKTGSQSGYYDYVYWPKTGKVASNNNAAKLDRADFDRPLEGLTRKMTDSGMNAHISMPSGSGLSDAIAEALKETTTTRTMRDLTGTIPLSEWMNPVGLADGKGDGITVTRDGKTLDSGYTARYDGRNRKVSALFSGDLEDGATYTFSFLVRITDKGAASGRKQLPVAVDDRAHTAWTDVTSINGKETTASRTDDDIAVPEVKVLARLVDALPGTGAKRSMTVAIASAGCLLSLLGLGAVLAYRRMYGK